MPVFELQHPDGRTFRVDAPDIDAAAPAVGNMPPAASVPADIAKQLGSGAAIGLAALPGAIPRVLDAAGRGVDWALTKLMPNSAKVQEMHQEELKRQALVDAMAGNRPESVVAAQVPQAQTTAGQFARTAASFVPAMAAMPGSMARNVATGALSGLGSEGAGQMMEGTSWETPGRIIGGLTGGAAGAKVLAPRPVPGPTIGQVKEAASAGYKNPAIEPVVFKPQVIENLASQISGELRRARLNARLAPQTHALVQEMRQPVTGSTFHRIEDVDATRQILGRLARNSSNPIEQAAASKAIDRIDKYMANLPQSHLIVGDAVAANAMLREARANYAGAKAAERANEKLRNAEPEAAKASRGNADAVTAAILARSPLGQSMGAGTVPVALGVVPAGLLGGVLGWQQIAAPDRATSAPSLWPRMLPPLQ
jgi:hypothetical protein